jgi:hypothetical protein
MQNKQAVRLQVTQKEKAARLLAGAFHGDPIYKLILPEEKKRIHVLFWLFRKIIHYSQLYGEVYTTPELKGVACWLPPGNTKFTFTRLLRSGLYAVPFKMGWKTYCHFNNYMQYMKKLHRNCVSESHWYLWTIGVDFSAQKKGVGSILLEKLLMKVNQDETACYLQTGKEENLSFYKKYGFKIVSEGIIPNQELPVWAMLRKG